MAPPRSRRCGSARCDIEERAREVHGEDALPLLEGELVGGGEGADAGDVDEDVEAAERVDGDRDGVLARHGVGDVAPHVERRRRRRGVRYDEVGACDLCTLGGEAGDDGAPDAARRPGDEGDTTVEATHRGTVARVATVPRWRAWTARSRS